MKQRLSLGMKKAVREYVYNNIARNARINNMYFEYGIFHVALSCRDEESVFLDNISLNIADIFKGNEYFNIECGIRDFERFSKIMLKENINRESFFKCNKLYNINGIEF